MTPIIPLLLAAGMALATSGNAAETASGSPADPAQAATSADVTGRLSGLLSAETRIGAPEDTPVDGITGVQAGGRYFYLDASGRYLFSGSLIDLATGENLTEMRVSAIRRDDLAAFADADKVVFPASGEEKAVIDVFTDTTCGYCARLHQEVPRLQAAGITVRYVPFPRGGPRGPGYTELRSVWCADDRGAALTAAKLGDDYQVGDTGCAAAVAVDAGYTLGARVGVNGTPAILLEDGTMVRGYRSADELAAILLPTGG